MLAIEVRLQGGYYYCVSPVYLRIISNISMILARRRVWRKTIDHLRKLTVTKREEWTTTDDDFDPGDGIWDQWLCFDFFVEEWGGRKSKISISKKVFSWNSKSSRKESLKIAFEIVNVFCQYVAFLKKYKDNPYAKSFKAPKTESLRSSFGPWE